MLFTESWSHRSLPPPPSPPASLSPYHPPPCDWRCDQCGSAVTVQARCSVPLCHYGGGSPSGHSVTDPGIWSPENPVLPAPPPVADATHPDDVYAARFPAPLWLPSSAPGGALSRDPCSVPQPRTQLATESLDSYWPQLSSGLMISLFTDPFVAKGNHSYHSDYTNPMFQ